MDTNGNYIQNQFCSYEIALKLKELGFDEECLTSFDPGWNFNVPSGRTKNNSNFPNENITNQKCAAPLWQQAIGKRLDDNNRIHFSCSYFCF